MAVNLVSDLIVRWPSGEAGDVELLRSAGVRAAIAAGPPAFARACAQAGIEVIAPERQPVLPLEQFESHKGPPAALKDGLWPGVTREPEQRGRGDETASASREPWVDANSFWVAYLRTMFPGRPPLLGYEGDFKETLVPYDSLELALIDARILGGNYLLGLDPRYRKALHAKEPKALEAWSSLGKTAAWLDRHRMLWGQPVAPAITLLVEEGQETPEIANLAYRRNASPALARAADPPPPDPTRRLAVVAVNLKEAPAPVRRRILAHAEAGASVVIDARWDDPRLKPLRKEQDRDFYTLGKGQVIVYHETVADPSEFALDVIDIVTHKRRPVRLWNAPAAIGIATACPENSPVPGKTMLILVNYGQPLDREFPARVQGHFSSATLLRPDAEPTPLKPARRGTTTEVFLSELRRLGVIVFG